MVKALVSQGSRNFAHNLDDLIERWQIKHEVVGSTPANEVRKMSDVEFDGYIRNMKIDGLLDLKNGLDKINQSIRQQLRNKPGNSQWSMDARKAREICGRLSQCIQLDISRKRKVKKGSFPSIFVNVAQEILDEETFRKIEQITVDQIRRRVTD